MQHFKRWTWVWSVLFSLSAWGVQSDANQNLLSWVRNHDLLVEQVGKDLLEVKALHLDFDSGECMGAASLQEPHAWVGTCHVQGTLEHSQAVFAVTVYETEAWPLIRVTVLSHGI